MRPRLTSPPRACTMVAAHGVAGFTSIQTGQVSRQHVANVLGMRIGLYWPLPVHLKYIALELWRSSGPVWQFRD